MSQTIAFNEIPANWDVPGAYSEVRAVRNGQSLEDFPTRALIIAPMITPAYTISGAYNVTSKVGADGLFGVGSIASAAVDTFIQNNPDTPLDVIGVPPLGTAVTASFSFAFAGAPLRSGVPVITVDGVRVPYLVNQTDSTAVQAASAAQAVNSFPDLPLVASSAGNVITLTAKQAGLIGTDIPLSFNFAQGDALPGMTFTLANFVAGAGVPDLGAILATVANTWYTDLICAWNDPASVAAIDADMTRRFNAMSKLDCHAYLGYRGSYGQALAVSPGMNSKFISSMPASNAGTAPWRWAAAVGGACSAALARDPARQLRSLQLVGIVGPADADLYLDPQRNILLKQGWSTFKKLVDGTVVLERVITNYQTSAQGVPDLSWRDIMVPKTMTRVRWDWDAYVTETYPRSKLADAGSIAAQLADDVVTTDVLHASWSGRYKLYESLGWLENSAALSKRAVFVRNPTSRNRADGQMPVQIIGNLMDVMSSIQFEV